MQNLFLKSLVLIGVIGGSCFMVWQAHESLQSTTVETDPNQFKSLESPEGQEGETDGLVQQSDESSADLGFKEITLDTQEKPLINDSAPRVASHSHGTESGPQPTVARPMEFTPKLSEQKKTTADTAPQRFPAIAENHNARPIEDSAPPEGLTELPEQSPESNADSKLEPQSANPVMPLSFYSASGKKIPSVAMLDDKPETPDLPENKIVPVSAEAPDEKEAPEIALASFEVAPGGNSEPEEKPSSHPFGPSANNVSATNDSASNPSGNNASENNSPKLTAPFPALPKQPAPEATEDELAANNDQLPAGLTRLPASQPGPILLSPEALPTLGLSRNLPSPKPSPSGVVTALGQEADEEELGQSPIAPASGEASNPFASRQNAPVNDEPVVPSSLGPNPFAKKQNEVMGENKFKPLPPADAGFNRPAPLPSVPEASNDPFSPGLKTAVLPGTQPEENGADAVPEDLLPPAEFNSAPPSRTTLPGLPLPPNPGTSSIPRTAPKLNDEQPPRMLEPQPLLPLSKKEPIPLTSAPAESPSESGDSLVLPGKLNPVGRDNLPEIRPSTQSSNSLTVGSQPGMLPLNSTNRTNSEIAPAADSTTGSFRNPYFTETPGPTTSTPVKADSPSSASPFAEKSSLTEATPLKVNNSLSSIPEAGGSVEPRGFPNSLIPTERQPTPAASESGVFPLGQSGQMSGNERPQLEKLSNTTSEPTLAKSKPTNDLVGNGTIDPTIGSGPQSPELKIEKIAPSEASIGEPLIYSIRIRNVGQSTARSVVVEDRIPRGTRLEGTIPQAVQTQDKLSWELGVIPAGEERTIQLKVTPLESGNIGSVATVSFEASVTTSIRVTAPELSVEIDGPTEALLGKNVPYKFTVRNTGQGNAKDVVLRAILPPSLKHPNGNDIEADLNEIEAGKSKTVELVVVADEVGVSTPKVLIWMDGKNHAENRADLHILESRLRITRTGPKRRFVGRPAQFITEITNDSSSQLTDISIVEQLPVSVEPVNPDAGWDPERRVIQRSIPSLMPGQTKQIVTDVIPKQAGELTGKLIAQDLSGNRAEVATPLSVKGFAELEAVVHGENKTVEVGEQVSLRLKLKNDGTASATNVQAAFEIPAGLTFSTASGPSDYDVHGSRVIFQPVLQMATNTEKTYDIVLTAAEVGEKKVKVALISDDYEEAINREEPVRVISAGQ